MAREQSSTEGMKGDGYYDAHSEYQRRVIEQADGLIRGVVASIDPLPADIFTVADYGSGTGATSVRAMSTVIAALRERDTDLPVDAIHNDVLDNDFTQLFHNIAAPDGYLSLPGGAIYPTAAAGSFFTQVVPAGTVQLGMCSNAAHWFREQPRVRVPDGMYFCDAKGEARAALARQAADDWSAFLEARSAELAPGGRMLVQGIGTTGDDAQHVSASRLLTQMWRTALSMADDGLLDRDALDNYLFPVYCRTVEETLAPVDGPGGLGVVSATVAEVANPYWEQFERDGDATAYAKTYVEFVRAFAESTMLEHLFRSEDLCSQYFAQLERDTAADPEAGRYEAWIVRLVLASPGQ